MSNFNDDRLFQQMKRIADALERQWPPLPNSADLVPAEAYVWHSDIRQLLPVHKVNRLALELLRGVDEQRDLLMANTTAFANRLPANNALLWGRGAPANHRLLKLYMVPFWPLTSIAGLLKFIARILLIYRF